MVLMHARTVSVSVLRDPDAVHEYLSDPRNLPDWAPGFAKSVREEGGGWVVETADGTVRIAFVPDNRLGVVDHRVTGEGGLDVLNPMRVIANGDGAEVLFTLFQPAGMADARFQRDLGLVESDLQTLKRVLEGGGR
jgi:hypothetical protein